MAHVNNWIIELDEAKHEHLRSAFASALDRLMTLPRDEAAQALADPRAIHRRVYALLTPPDHPEFAGNYRGSDFPGLKESVVASSFNENQGTAILTLPWDVERMMGRYGEAVIEAGKLQPASVEDALAYYGRIMIAFGLIHPFQDGNGHVQRLAFQYFMQRAGFQMAPSWAIHPCPYDEPMHRALASGELQTVARLLRPFMREPGRRNSV